MLFLYGTKNKQKQLATSRELLCPCCNNVSRWQVVKHTTWFTMFFIPMIPLKNQYFEMCPVCKAGRKLTKKQANQWKS